MKKFLLMLLPIAALVTGCRYDDSDVWDELNNHETRLLALEQKVNTDLATLQAAIEALNNKVYVSSVTSTSNGFTVTFTNGNSYTISNGESSTPVISVKEDTDGVYYWTVDGEWLLDGDGNKVCAEAVAPQVKIEDDKWYVSTDGGTTWTEAGPAVGEGIFKNVAQEEGYLLLTLQDDTVIAVPMAELMKKLQLVFDESQIQSIPAGATAEVTYQVVVPEGETFEFETFENNGYTVTVTPADAEGLSGTIAVTAPSPLVKGKVLFILTGSKGSSFVKSVTVNGDPSISADKTEYAIDSRAGSFEIAVTANVPYTSEIEAGITWLTKGAAENQFTVEANTSTTDNRSATVTFTAEGLQPVVVTVTQNAIEAIILTTTEATVAADDESFSVVINTNAVVTATPDVDWIHPVEATKANRVNQINYPEKVFEFTLDANEGEVRVGHVKFSAADVEQTVTITQEPTLLTIAAVKAMENGAVEGYIKNATVSYIVGSYTYIEDATGGIPIFKNGGVGLKVGDVVTGKITGTKGAYGGAPQFTAFDFSGATVSEGEAPLTEVSLADLLESDDAYNSYFARRIKLVDVTVTQAMSASARTGKVSQGELEYQLYNSDKNNALNLNLGDEIDLICFPTFYNSTKQASVFTGLVTKHYGKLTPSLEFAHSEVNLAIEGTQANVATTNSDATVVYESANPAVATVDQSGTITAVAIGTTTIKASVAETDNYLAAETTCTVNVTETVSYDFESIAELNALVTSTSAQYSGYLTGAVVSFVPTTNQAIIKDATGSILYFKSNHGLKQGQTFTGAINVTAVLYNSNYSELTAIDAVFTGEESAVEPVAATLAELSGNYGTWQNAYVKVANLTVVSASGKNITVTDGQDHQYIVFTNYANATNSAGDVITATGTVTKFNSIEEIKVWKAADLEIISATPSIEASDISGVSSEGVTGATTTVTIKNGEGWTVSVAPDGDVVTAATIEENVITYSVAANTGEARKGKITVTLTKTGETDIVKEITVSQKAAGSGETPDPETITFSELSYGNGAEITTVNGENFTITFNKGTNSSSPKYYTGGSAIRAYGGNFFTVSSENTISKIEITFGSSDGSNEISTDTGTYGNGTWTGEATSVKFTIGGTTGHRRIASIKVTF